jgi:protein-L-isoaspartate O-methyltransferase
MPSLNENVARVAQYYAARAHEYHETTGYDDTQTDAGYTELKATHQAAFKGLDVIEIACGTGYWTEVIAQTARSVLATDIHAQLIEITRERLKSLTHVRCEVADAYTLAGVDGTFSGAFAHYWWSHIPKAMRRTFLDSLHEKLRPGAFVSFTDNLEYQADWVKRRIDEHGDVYEERRLRDGSCFETIKNFPSEAEFVELLSGMADDLSFLEHRAGPLDDPTSRLWTVSYRLKK